MFDYIIIDIIRNNKFTRPPEGSYCLFTQIENNIIYMYRGSLQDFSGKKELTSVYKFHVYKSILKYRYETLFYILKSNTSSWDMNEKLDHWLDSFEKFHKKYIIMPSELLNSYLFHQSRK